jgi:tRNA (mo5U34)-methyltransferase
MTDASSARADLRTQIDQITWFHSIALAPGVVTPGLDATRDRLDLLRIPADLRGKSVLDVGAWDGFFSFEAERRGADRVLATDSFAWDGANWSTKAGFELCRSVLDSRVQDQHIDVMDLSPDALGGRFDVVLCLGVLYHMRHPLLMVERVASVTRELLVLETHVDMTWTRRPAMAFYADRLGVDPTNWWGPNPEAVAGMLRSAGFDHVEIVTPNTTAYRALRSLRRLPRYVEGRFRHGSRPTAHPSQGRVVVHARRNVPSSTSLN